jgi:adenosylhomocysteinase
MSARVIVCEVDPVKALEAVMDGFEVLPIGEAAEVGDIFVTVTGNRDAIGVEELRAMKSGAIVCNSGHFDVEIDIAGLRDEAVSTFEPRENVVEYTLRDGREIVVLAEGRLVGQACAEAHPAAVMDMSFATQALAVEHLVRGHDGLTNDVHDVPAEIDERVARMKLQALGVRHDELSARQREYLSTWTAGT